MTGIGQADVTSVGPGNISDAGVAVAAAMGTVSTHRVDDPVSVLEVARSQLDIDLLWLGRHDGTSLRVVASTARFGRGGPMPGSAAVPDPAGSVTAILDDAGREVGAVVASAFGDRVNPDYGAAVLKLVAALLGTNVQRDPLLTPSADRQPSVRSVFQPVVRLADRQTVGYEALARVDGTSLSPADLFATAAHAGARADLEMIALGSALAELDRVPRGCWLSVNLSPWAVFDPRLEAMLADIEAERVTVEITEHARVDDYASLRRRLWTLRRSGVALSVDDAGAGFASFRHVLELRPDSIKLDADLTHQIDRDRLRRELAGALATFARRVGTTLVAEGVETPAERDVLSELGIEHGQGYLFGRPAALPAVTPG